MTTIIPKRNYNTIYTTLNIKVWIKRTPLKVISDFQSLIYGRFFKINPFSSIDFNSKKIIYKYAKMATQARETRLY